MSASHSGCIDAVSQLDSARGKSLCGPPDEDFLNGRKNAQKAQDKWLV
jgi:hypothetical protein